MKKRLIAAAAALLLALPALAGCDQIGWTQKEEMPSFPVTVDGVSIQKKPRAVASLSPLLTALLLDLGYQERIVGYSADDQLPEGVTLDQIPSPDAADSESAPEGAQPGVSIPEGWDGKTPLPGEPLLRGRVGTALEPDMAAVGILKPEVIFTTLPFSRAQMELLDGVGIKVLVMPAVFSLNDLKIRILAITSIMDGKTASDTEGKAMLAELDRQLAYIQSQVPPERSSFLYVCTNELLVATGDTFEGDLLSLIGKNLASEKRSYTLTPEELEGMDPNMILYSAPVERANVEQSAEFRSKTAVHGGGLVEVDGAGLTTQTRGVVETIRTIAKQMYPNVNFDEPAPAASGE